MKYVLLSCFLFCFSYTCLGENIFKKKQEIDSVTYYFQLTNNPRTDSSLTRAYSFFSKQRLENLQLKDTTAIILNLRGIAVIQNKLGDYFGSEATVVEALKLLDKTKKTEQTIVDKTGLLNQLGRIYMELLDYNAAIRYFDEALKIAKSKNYINIIQNNKALVYIEQEQYELAEKEFLEVYANSILQNNKMQIARSLNNLGFVQSKLNREGAFDKLTEALQLRLSIKDNPGTYSSFRNLSRYYTDRGQIAEANEYANKAYNMAKLVNSPSFIVDALTNLIKVGSEANASEYMKITDSISKAKLRQENKYAKIKYDYTEKEKLAKQNELEAEKEKNLKLIYLGLGVLISCILIATLIIRNEKYKKDKLQVIYNTETRISKKVHDEVANDVYHTMTKLQNNLNNNEELLDDLEHIYNKTRNISRESGTIDLKADFSIILNDLLLAYKEDGLIIVTRGLKEINWKTVSELKRTAIYRVLQELMTNMKKHSKATLLSITFNKNNSKIEINYKDNGVGANIKTLNGLENVESRIHAMGGTVTFETKEGEGFKVKALI